MFGALITPTFDTVAVDVNVWPGADDSDPQGMDWYDSVEERDEARAEWVAAQAPFAGIDPLEGNVYDLFEGEDY